MIFTRLWDYRLLPYLPDLQFRGQLREIVLIMHDWRDRGKTNHLLINRVMSYPKGELTAYYMHYENEYVKRYNKFPKGYLAEFMEFCDYLPLCEKNGVVFKDWHNKNYLRVCVANLYEKYHFGIGNSKISQEEWDRVLQGYKNITGEDYKI